MTGASAQRKGADGERELARILSAMFGVEARRGARPYLFGSMGPDVYGLPGIHIEAKRRESLSLPAALRQSAGDSANEEVPVVMHRANGCGWIVSVWLADLIRLAEAVARRNEWTLDHAAEGGRAAPAGAGEAGRADP